MWDVCSHQQKPEAVYKNFDIYHCFFVFLSCYFYLSSETWYFKNMVLKITFLLYCYCYIFLFTDDVN